MRATLDTAVMTAAMIHFAIIALAAIPAGAAATLAARRLAETAAPPAWLLIVLSIMLGLWAAAVIPWGVLLAVTCLLGWMLLVLAAVDALAFRLPDMLNLPLIALGIAVSNLLPQPDVMGHVIGMIAGLLSFYAIAEGYRAARGREGLGLGDVKLAGAAGAWLGWQALPFVVLVACFVGLVWVGLAAARRGSEGLQERIPFGVALGFALWTIWLHGLPEFLTG